MSLFNETNDFSSAPPVDGDPQNHFSSASKPVMQKSDWVHDDAAEECFHCKAKFSVIKRRHHCRLCGQIFCDDCTPQRKLLPVEYNLSEPQRVCNPCARTVEMQQLQLQETIANSMQANQLTDGAYTGKLKRYFNSPFRFDLRAELRKATWTIHNQTSGIEAKLKDDDLKQKLFNNCHGLAIISVVQAGCIGGIRAGTGLVVTRRGEKEWSAPCAVGLFGVGFGALIGAEVTDMVVAFDSESALRSFQSEGQVTLGGEMSLSLGPIGRNAKADLRANTSAAATTLSYSHSKGIYGGISLETSFLKVRNDVNRDFYGRRVRAGEIFDGLVSPPPAAEVLYNALNDLCESISQVRKPVDSWSIGASGGGASAPTSQQTPAYEACYPEDPPNRPQSENVFEC